MATKDTRAKDRQALACLLEVYGADRTRWPARERLRFASFICEDEAARRLVAEGAALDALLDRASRASEEREHALKERIVAAAMRSGERKLAVVAGHGAGSAARLAAMLPVWAHRPSFTKVTTRAEWPAAALLAASLVVGVVLGSAGTFDTTVQQMAEATGFATASEFPQLALGEEIMTITDEDLL
jgi:hypothetical protein